VRAQSIGVTVNPAYQTQQRQGDGDRVLNSMRCNVSLLWGWASTTNDLGATRMF
jgi:hypothetical protein